MTTPTDDCEKDTYTDPAGIMASGTTVDAEEIAFFARIADSWWDPSGPFKPLHALNPTRLSYIRTCLVDHFKLDSRSLKPLQGLKILDIGCGGGLLSEPLARMGAGMTSVDASDRNITVAKLHAEQSGLGIDYRCTTAEELAGSGVQFDVVINMEVIEHVADVHAYLSACRALVKTDGAMLVSTLNRTAKSLLLAKIGAEYILRWLPRGAHDWQKFITPDELAGHLAVAGFDMVDRTGFVFSPFRWDWRLDPKDLDVGYAAMAVPDQIN